jgi:hypothetical protein
MVDVAPTLAALLGTDLPASGQGHPRTEMLDAPLRLVTLQAALTAQQNQLYQAYNAAIDRSVPLEAGDDVVAATQQAMDRARLLRLDGERVPRTALAILLMVLPGSILVFRRSKKWPWVLMGALLFLGLFNLRYALLDGRPYSLSAVDSQDWLISFVGSTAAVALAVGWLVTVLGTRAFSREPASAEGSIPRQAAGITLRLLWLILYLLSLPVLVNLAVNGPLVTWTLPEFHTAYLALLAMIQGIIVAAIGLLLTGIAAGIGWLVARRT